MFSPLPNPFPHFLSLEEKMATFQETTEKPALWYFLGGITYWLLAAEEDPFIG